MTMETISEQQILSLLQKIPESKKDDIFLLSSEKSKDEMLLAVLKKMSASEKKQAFMLAGCSAAQLLDGLQTEPDAPMDDVASVVSDDGQVA